MEWRVLVLGRPMTEKERNLISRKNLIDETGEFIDLSRLGEADLKPFSCLPKSLKTKLMRRPKAAVTKKRISIRLSPDGLQSVRESGEG